MTLVDNRPFISLDKTDIAAILTIDGRFSGIWLHSEKECLENADTIYELMIRCMKDDDHLDGVWMWYINESCTDAIGCYLGEVEDV